MFFCRGQSFPQDHSPSQKHTLQSHEGSNVYVTEPHVTAGNVSPAQASHKQLFALGNWQGSDNPIASWQVNDYSFLCFGLAKTIICMESIKIIYMCIQLT
jgi:hypothetical protein